MSDNSGVMNTGSGGTINIGNRNVFGYQPHVTHVTLTTSENALLEALCASMWPPIRLSGSTHIFLSHASVDREPAQILLHALEKFGVDVGVDDFSLRYGRSFVRAIDRGIALSRIGVILVTPTVIAGRPWVEKEFSALLADKETVIPILHGVTNTRSCGDTVHYYTSRRV